MKPLIHSRLRWACAPITCLCVVLSAVGQQVTGQWDFTNGLQATLGADAGYWSSVRDVTIETRFGTTTSFGIADIAGQPARVMKFPDNQSFMGYKMFPEIDANGGGAYVNQFTFIFDVLYPASSSGVYRGLLQANDCNTNEAELFINPDNGVGIAGNYAGNITPDEWHRVAVSVDLAASRLVKYVDGVYVGEQSNGLGVVDGFYSLWTRNDNLPTLIFTDNSGETAVGYTNSVQIRNYIMSDAEVAALGGPSAAGIPGGAGVTGQWDFENGNLAATMGRDLEYFRGCVPRDCNQDLPGATQFGSAGSFGVPRINGKDPQIMSFPLVEPCYGYLFTHGVAPNGGGNFVNQYTLILDVYYPAIDAEGWAAIYQTGAANTEDAEAYIRGSDGGLGINGQYGGQVLDGRWHRLGIVADLTVGSVRFYVDGLPGSSISDEGLDGRFSLDETILLFAEPAFYSSAGYVNSVQIRDYAMSSEEMEALGGPTAAGIGSADARPAPDANNDGFVNQEDLGALLACVTGPGLALQEADLFNCESFDADHDLDIDQSDFGLFQQYYRGSEPCGERCFYP